MTQLARFISNYRKARWFAKGQVAGVRRDGVVSHYLNRHVSAVFTALLLDRSVTPNQVSICVFLLGIMTCIPLYLAGHHPAAGLMVWLISILDGVDGEIARAKGLITSRGQFIDSILDRLFDIAVILSIALSVGFHKPSFVPWLFAYIAFVGLFLDYYSLELYGNRIDGYQIVSAQVEITKTVRFWPARDVFLFIISVSSLIQMPEVGLLVAGILSGVFSIVRLLIVLV